MTLQTIHTLKTKKYQWINVTCPGEEEMGFISKKYAIHPFDIKDCLPPIQRPKVVIRPGHNYIFTIFVFPVLNPKTREIEQHEVDFIIMKNRIITVHDDSFTEIKNFYQTLQAAPEHFAELTHNPTRFVAQLLDELFDACFPMLFNLSNDIDSLRSAAMRDFSRNTVHEILRLKNNVVTFRKIMQPHRDLLRRLMHLLPRCIKISGEDIHYFDRLIDHTKEIWDHLEIYLNAIDAVQNTHVTLLSFRLNEIMKTLTAFSLILLSLNLFSNIFIMEGLDRPIIGQPGDWWFLLAIMTLGGLIGLGIFKKKKWL